MAAVVVTSSGAFRATMEVGGHGAATTAVEAAVEAAAAAGAAAVAGTVTITTATTATTAATATAAAGATATPAIAAAVTVPGHGHHWAFRACATCGAWRSL